jgi:galactosamine-6-phosphate isomerase
MNAVSTPNPARFGFRLEVLEDYERLSEAAAEIIRSQALANPRMLLCLATGGSPSRTYEFLVSKGRDHPGLFGQMRVLKLDEWGGLARDAAGSCEAYLREHVVGPLGISEDRFFGFANDAASPEAECERLRAWLAENGPIDLCLLGLGTNGHLGLNEPGRALSPFAHRAVLSQESLGHSMLRASAERPAYGLTIGMAEILQSRHILLLVNGEHKRRQLRRLMQKEITCDFPASFLWLHPNTTVLCDREAFDATPDTSPKS